MRRRRRAGAWGRPPPHPRPLPKPETSVPTACPTPDVAAPPSPTPPAAPHGPGAPPATAPRAPSPARRSARRRPSTAAYWAMLPSRQPPRGAAITPRPGSGLGVAMATRRAFKAAAFSVRTAPQHRDEAGRLFLYFLVILTRFTQ